MEMMTGRTLFRNYKEYDQKEVEICGWVKSNRGSKKFGFLVINDGTFFEPIQVVYDQEMGNFDTVSKLNVGTAVIVNGTVIVTPDAKQPFEIHAKSVESRRMPIPIIHYSKKTSYIRIFKIYLSFKTKNEYVSGSIQSSFSDCICDP